MWTFPLDDAAALDRARAGGKGVGLARLLRAGLPVPAAYVVDASAMRAVVGPDAAKQPPQVWSDASVRADAARRTESIRTAPLPEGLAEEVRAILGALGPGAIAVRSSALDEDGAARSAAGQYDTVLGVQGLDATLAAIRTCWASAHGHRAAIYRARTGAAPFDAPCAVILQRMADSDQSGVIFTRDPMYPERPTMIVESSPTPEAAVQGARTTRHHLPRPLGAVHPLIRYDATSDDRSFGDGQLRELAALALRAETALGVPADVEWAWSGEFGFQLLQLRPITSLRTQARGRGILWTQRFSGERWTEPATPLGWSIVRSALERFTHWEWASRAYLGGSPLARVHAGTPYFNVTIFRHLVPQTPWTPTPEFVLELLPPDEQEALRRRRWHLPTPGLVALVLAEALLRGRWRGHRFLWSTNPRDWERLAPKIETAAHVALTAPPPADSAAALRALAPLLRLLDRYVGVHVWSLLWANLFYQALGVCLMRWGGPGLHARRPALVVGAGRENLTLRTNIAVWRLAALAHAEPPLETRLLDSASGAEALAAIRALRHGTDGTDDATASAARHFLSALDELLARYGHRSRATWEVFSRRWRDEPETVVDMVRALLRMGPAADPLLRDQQMAEGRGNAERALDAALRGWRLRLARWVVGHTRVFSLLRENQRFVFDRLMLAIRDACLRVGDLLVAERRLVNAADVVHLELDELRLLAAGGLSCVEAARRIAERKADAAHAARSPTPIFLIDDETTAEARAPSPTPVGASTLRGLGISPGRITGKARIARSLSDVADLRPGEILVVKSTDPGWTPYFSAAGGLVTELGGLLSHAAVVAREYGLPAVANVADATSILKNGDALTIDGTSGLVFCGNK